MKSRYVKVRLWSLVFSILFAGVMITPASAITQRASEYIDFCFADISSSSKGNVTVSFLISSYRSMDKIGATTIYLYEDSGDGFELAKTFRHTSRDYSYILGENEEYYQESVSYDGTSGNDYYAVVYFLAEDESGGDTDKVETTIVTAR